jgi:hypothetical protein
MSVTFQHFLEFLSLCLSGSVLNIHLTRQLMKTFSPNEVFWKRKIPDCVQEFVLSRYDVRKLHSNNKSVRNILCCSELSSLISISLILI